MTFNVAYVEVNSNSFSNVGCYTLQNGQQFFDFACIFAANINYDDTTGKPILFFNPNVAKILNETDDVKTLQNLGIKVLLTVLGNHQNAGWSCFTDETTAMDFAQQLANAVKQYGLDGIDIDDEYSPCITNDTSLIKVTHAMRQLMPDKIISKALFDDINYFNASWNNLTLADILSYGWEMSYWESDCESRIQPYLDAGMQKNQLAVGVSTNNPVSIAKDIAQCVKENDYGGTMVYNLTKNSQDFLSVISQIQSNENTVTKPDCLRA